MSAPPYNNQYTYQVPSPQYTSQPSYSQSITQLDANQSRSIAAALRPLTSEFVLVPISAVYSDSAKWPVTNLDKKPVGISGRDFRPQYEKLRPAIEGNSACNASALLAHSSTPVSGGNTPYGKHAEENVIYDLYQSSTSTDTTFELDCMHITIEPCRGREYPGHKCLKLFTQGRELEGINLKFVPRADRQYTPIFFESSLGEMRHAMLRTSAANSHASFKDWLAHRYAPAGDYYNGEEVAHYDEDRRKTEQVPEWRIGQRSPNRPDYVAATKAQNEKKRRSQSRHKNLFLYNS
jgi:hypothetical protein